MTLHDLREWLAVLNVLLVPLVVYAWRIERAIVETRAAQAAHEKLDDERFTQLRRDVDRIEERQTQGA